MKKIKTFLFFIFSFILYLHLLQIGGLLWLLLNLFVYCMYMYIYTFFLDLSKTLI